MVINRIALLQRGHLIAGTGDCGSNVLISAVIVISLRRLSREREHTLSLSH
jgi:hypothetical protein